MIAAGFGFTSSASADSLRDAFEAAARGHAVDLLATAEDKAAHPGLAALAAGLSLPLTGIPDATLAAMQTQTRSPRSLAARGTGSMAEAAALAAAGPGARLLGPRRISTDRRATCAVAIGDQT